MKCAVHSELDAAGYCRNCGKPMCPACTRPVRDVLYCEDCLAKITGLTASSEPLFTPNPSSAAPSATRPTGSNSTVALILGFVPGLGAIYNGEYNKALIHIVVFAAIIFGLASDMDDPMKAVLGILLGGFVLYMAFDAMRTAQAKRLGEAPDDSLQTWSKDRPIGPIILIGLGVLFLLDNFGFFAFFQVHRFWPVILIAVGILMFRNRIGNRF
ncbi:MAG: hypothetical protein PVS2B2_25070 [Candidatus Acidiferrum sp.]